MKIATAALAALSVVALAVPAAAHHSAAMFDATKEVSVVGTIKQFQYTNPHAWLIVSGTTPDGKMADWSIELGAPTAINRMGIQKSTFPVGDKITVKMHPMKDGRNGGEFLSVTKADGTVVGGRAGPPAPPTAPRPGA